MASQPIRLITLGTGTPRPTPSRTSSCALLIVGEDHLLFDVGRGSVLQLVKAGIPWSKITRLFVTHHHYDHIGDLPDLVLTSWLNGRTDEMKIYGPPPTSNIVDMQLSQIYARDIQFREAEFANSKHPTLGTFRTVRVVNVLNGIVEQTPNWTVKSIEVEHGHKQLGSVFRRQWMCLGYRVEVGGKVIVISGDTVRCDALIELAKDADLLLQCCWLPTKELDTEYARSVGSHTLACSDVVGKIATEAGVKRLVLTHTRAITPESISAMQEEAALDYSGPIHVAQDLEEFEIQ